MEETNTDKAVKNMKCMIIDNQIEYFKICRDKEEIGSFSWRKYQIEIDKLEERKRLIAG